MISLTANREAPTEPRVEEAAEAEEEEEEEETDPRGNRRQRLDPERGTMMEELDPLHFPEDSGSR